MGLWGRICPLTPSWLLVGCQPSLAFLGLSLPHFNICLCLRMTVFPLWVHVSSHSCLLIRLLVFIFRTHLNSVWFHLNLITFAKIWYPNEVTVTGISLGLTLQHIFVGDTIQLTILGILIETKMSLSVWAISVNRVKLKHMYNIIHNHEFILIYSIPIQCHRFSLSFFLFCICILNSDN